MDVPTWEEPMTFALLLLALLVLLPVAIRIGSRGEAGTVAAAALTAGVVVAGMSSLT